jgi:hypothetical protein
MEKEGQQSYKKIGWSSMQKTPAYTAWGGYAFENICIKHVDQLKKALQIGGVYTTFSSWIQTGKGKDRGAQIDLVIDRADKCINICEMKFSTTPYLIDKKYANSLQNKVMQFRQSTQTNKTLFLTFITTYGVVDNDYKTQRVDAEVRMNSLFEN